MTNLDDTDCFNAALRFSLDLGIKHVAAGTKRLKPGALLQHIATHVFKADVSRRQFHIETLNRAYGLAFTNASKMAYAKTLTA